MNNEDYAELALRTERVNLQEELHRREYDIGAWNVTQQEWQDKATNAELNILNLRVEMFAHPGLEEENESSIQKWNEAITHYNQKIIEMATIISNLKNQKVFLQERIDQITLMVPIPPEK